jgi:hypothetical protein
MHYLKSLTLIFGIMILISCKQDKKTGIVNSATVYSGGDIITMEGDKPLYVEAIVVNNGKIEFLGTTRDAMNFAGEGHNMINLEGKTLLMHTHILLHFQPKL